MDIRGDKLWLTAGELQGVYSEADETAAAQSLAYKALAHMRTVVESEAEQIAEKLDTSNNKSFYLGSPLSVEGQRMRRRYRQLRSRLSSSDFDDPTDVNSLFIFSPSATSEYAPDTEPAQFDLPLAESIRPISSQLMSRATALDLSASVRLRRNERMLAGTQHDDSSVESFADTMQHIAQTETKLADRYRLQAYDLLSHLAVDAVEAQQ